MSHDIEYIEIAAPYRAAMGQALPASAPYSMMGYDQARLTLQKRYRHHFERDLGGAARGTP